MSAPRDTAPGSTNGQAPHLVSLAAVTWNFGLVGRTRMLTEAWLRAEQPTTFVQVPSLRTAAEKVTGLFKHNPEHVVRPWPTYPARMWSVLPERTLRRAVNVPAKALERQLDRQVAWDRSVAMVVSPVWTPWLNRLPFRRVVYDCIDDVAVHTPSARLARLYRRWEDELLERADAAVVTAGPLGEELRRRRPGLPLRLIRNGVDPERFRSQASADGRPGDLPPADRPIIGFVGALYEWIDWKLITQAVAALGDCRFVFVGPDNGHRAMQRLAEQEHVAFLGARPYEQVPAYVAAFDVCWVPFDSSRVSRAANPVKMYEYLALGKPVVTTPVADTASFGDLVRVGETPEQIVEQLRAALADRSESAAAARSRFADENSWRARADEYGDFARELLKR